MSEEQTAERIAETVRDALLALGRTDPTLLLGSAQVRGMLADRKIEDRNLRIVFGELASHSLLYDWWYAPENSDGDSYAELVQRAQHLVTLSRVSLWPGILERVLAPVPAGLVLPRPIFCSEDERSEEDSQTTPVSDSHEQNQSDLVASTKRESDSSDASDDEAPVAEPDLENHLEADENVVSSTPHSPESNSAKGLWFGAALALGGVMAIWLVWPMTQLASTVPSVGNPPRVPDALPADSFKGISRCDEGFVAISPGTVAISDARSARDASKQRESRQLTVSRGFCIQITEVTQAEWQTVMGGAPRTEFVTCGADCPIQRITFRDALAYANQKSRAAGLTPCYVGMKSIGNECDGYRLPTEAEWEFAARAGQSGARVRDPDGIAWFDQNSGGSPHPVRRKAPNAWGTYDMLGNVWEWTVASEESSHSGEPRNPSDDSHALRGGAWSSAERELSVGAVRWRPSVFSSEDVGFRLARSMR